MLKTLVTIMTKEISGLIIRLVDYKESSYIVHILTNNCIESVVCKGIKKQTSKLKGYIQIYSYVTLLVTDGKIPILTDISEYKRYDNICTNLNKYKYAGLLINMLYKEKYENNKVYELVLKSIDFIDSGNEEYYYYLFLLKNLFFIGLGLNFTGISDKIVGYNISESKLVFSNDSISADISKTNTLTIYELYYSHLEEVIDVDLIMLKTFLKKYYEIHASIKI